MNQNSHQAKNPEEEYINSAIAHRELIESGNKKRANSAHDKIIKSIKSIRGREDKGKSFLLSNLSHSDEGVRLWSASHLLPLDEFKALRELSKLSKSAASFFVRSSADVTEIEWRKGTLDIDWFMK
jgi:hypothetical protein